MCLVFAMAVSAGAVSEESTKVMGEASLSNMQIEMLTAIFENRNTCQVFDQQGNDITNSFTAQHQENYALRNYEAIINDMGTRGLCATYPDTAIGLKMTLTHSVSSRISMLYTDYGGRTRMASTTAVVKCKVHDSTNQFVEVLPAALTNNDAGTPNAQVSGYGYGVSITDHGTRAHQHIRFDVKLGTSTLATSQWSALTVVGSNTLTCTRIPD